VVGYERPIIGNRVTYIINDKVEFTGDHPFLSTEGWKVADLDLYFTIPRNLDEDPTLMQKGDILLTENGPVEIKSLEINTSRSSSETVYDLKLDGNNTYMADGFEVHNCI